MSNSATPGLGWILAAPRSAFSIRALVPVWLWIWALDALVRLLPGELAAWVVLPLVGLTGIPLWAFCALLSASSAARKPIVLRAAIARVRRACPTFYSAPLFTVVVPALFLAVAWAGAILGRIPIVGGGLLLAWASTGGLVLSILAACWILVGLPSITLQIPASVIEHPHPMDVASRALSYVRRRPLLLAWSSLASVAITLLATAVFVAFLSIVMGSLLTILGVGAGARPEISALGSQVAAVWRQPSVWWPFPAPWPDRVATSVPLGELLVARFAPAFLLVSLAAASARVYACMRLAIDDVPLGSMDS